MDLIELSPDKAIYFASDFHLGIPDQVRSREREKLIIEWLDSIQEDAQVLFLLGDIFDVWFEYRHTVPRGYVRLLAKLASLVEKGIRVDVFSGNHDLWMRDYFPSELGIKVHHRPYEFSTVQDVFLIGHGDGLGPGDRGYKILKKVLRNPFAQWLYRLVHPSIGIPLATWFSRKGEKHDEDYREKYLGDDQEYLVRYAAEISEVDYFIFGHRHLAIEYKFRNGATYINTGDWIGPQTYVRYDTNGCVLQSFTGKDDEIIRIQQD